MQKIFVDDLVQFFDGEKNMYGTVVEYDKENDEFIILANNRLYRHIKSYLIFRDYGNEKNEQ